MKQRHFNWLAVPIGAVLLALSVRESSQDLSRSRSPLHDQLMRPASAAVSTVTEEPSLLIVFQAEDCFGNGDMIANWNDLHRAGNAQVIGLRVDRGEPPVTRIMPSGFEFPVANIDSKSARSVAEYIGYSSTPFAVLFDVEGSVIATFQGTLPVSPSVIADILKEATTSTAADGLGQRVSAATPLARPEPVMVADLF